MKIALFDTGHFETAYTLIRLFDQPGNKVIIFTNGQTEGILKDMLRNDQDRFDWFIVDRWIGNFNYFLYVRRQLKFISPEIIYFNTIDRLPFYYALMLNSLPHTRVILTIHDINCFFHKGNWKNVGDMLRWQSRKFLLREVEALNVISETMLPKLRQKTNYRFPVIHIPGAVYEHEHQELVQTQRLRIVVPGSIDQKRRNYDDVFLVGELAEEAGLPVDITLAGGTQTLYGKAVLNKAKQWKGQYCNILSYDGNMLLPAAYDRILRTAHFIFSPAVIQTKICGDIPETYGISKSSGSISDAIRFAKPFIVPAELMISRRLESSAFKYNSLNDITDLLFRIFKNPETYSVWKENAIRNSGWYGTREVRERNASVFFSE